MQFMLQFHRTMGYRTFNLAYSRKHVTFSIFSDSLCGRVIAARKIYQCHGDTYRAVNGNKRKMKRREAIVSLIRRDGYANDILRAGRRCSPSHLRLLRKEWDGLKKRQGGQKKIVLTDKARY